MLPFLKPSPDQVLSEHQAEKENKYNLDKCPLDMDASANLTFYNRMFAHYCNVQTFSYERKFNLQMDPVYCKCVWCILSSYKSCTYIYISPVSL